MKVSPTTKRLKASAGSLKPATRSQKPKPRTETLTPSVVDVASDNINNAAVVIGASHGTATAKRGAASTDPQVSAGTSQSAKAAGN